MSRVESDFDYLGPTIERCPHDKENPYAQVSRSLIRDNSISPNCRMILIFLLSNDARKWVIRVNQVWHAFDGHIGRDKTYRLINEAIEAGYMRREEYFHGNLKRCRYYLSEEPKFKKCYRHPDFQDPGAEDPENKDALERTSSQERTSKETTTRKKKEQAAPVVAVSFEKDREEKKSEKKNPDNPKIHQCLIEIDVSEKEKVWLTKKHDEETVKNAILWALHPLTEIKTTLIAAIKWACTERPQIPKNKDELEREEKEKADKVKRENEIWIEKTGFISGNTYNDWKFSKSENTIEFSQKKKGFWPLGWYQKDFVEQFVRYIKHWGIEMPNQEIMEEI